MKFLGRDEVVTLAEVQKSADDLRVTFDFFSTDVGKLQEKLQNNPLWLVETMWRLRKNVGTVTNERGLSPAALARVIGLSLDLEYLEDRVKDFAELLPDFVNSQAEVEYRELNAFLISAESSFRIYELIIQTAMMGVSIESEDLPSLLDMEKEVRDYIDRLEKVTVSPKSFFMSIRLIKLRHQYESLLMQFDYVSDLQVGLEKKQLKKAAEQAKLYRFCDAQSAVAAVCRKARDWLEQTSDEHYEECCRALAYEVRRAMSELGAATIELQDHPGYGKYRSEYDAASLTSKSVLASIDKAVQHHQNSLTRWGRFANWIDKCLRTKEPM
jgi:hypothetical protein